MRGKGAVPTREADEVRPFGLEAADRCCHYWVIETPNGPTSKGTCRFCGEEREFNNSPPQKSLRDHQHASKPEV